MAFCLVSSRKVDLSKFAQLTSDKIQVKTHLLALSSVFFPLIHSLEWNIQDEL